MVSKEWEGARQARPCYRTNPSSVLRKSGGVVRVETKGA